MPRTPTCNRRIFAEFPADTAFSARVDRSNRQELPFAARRFRILPLRQPERLKTSVRYDRMPADTACCISGLGEVHRGAS